MQIRKKWKAFLTNILKNIIWHLFAGESHQVVKITVTYSPVTAHFQVQRRIFATASERRSRVEKLTSDS